MGVQYTVIIIGNPHNPVLIVKAPTLADKTTGDIAHGTYLEPMHGRKWTDELICIFVLVLAFSAALVPGICVISGAFSGLGVGLVVSNMFCSV